MIAALAVAGFLLSVAPALAQDAGFTAGPNNAKVHASGFICPLKIGPFERDVAGLRSPVTGADYCAYSAPSGIYGTVIIMALPSPFDPKVTLASEFGVEEGTHSRLIPDTEKTQQIGSIPVYQRAYETARIETRAYRTLYASAAVGAWAVTAIVEYSYPQDKTIAAAFLAAVYGEAAKDLVPRANR